LHLDLASINPAYQYIVNNIQWQRGCSVAARAVVIKFFCTATVGCHAWQRDVVI